MAGVGFEPKRLEKVPGDEKTNVIFIWYKEHDEGLRKGLWKTGTFFKMW